MPIRHPWHEVSPGDYQSGVVNAIIEIPQGTRGKYETDKETGLIRLDRVVPSSMVYPVNYGIIPQTLFDDGDPLDILVVCAVPILPLALVYARVIGLMHMEDTGVPDDKIIAVAQHDMTVREIRTLRDLPPHFFREVEAFFEDYKKLEGKKVTVSEFRETDVAMKTIERSVVMYRNHFTSGT